MHLVKAHHLKHTNKHYTFCKALISGHEKSSYSINLVARREVNFTFVTLFSLTLQKYHFQITSKHTHNTMFKCKHFKLPTSLQYLYEGMHILLVLLHCPNEWLGCRKGGNFEICNVLLLLLPYYVLF